MVTTAGPVTAAGIAAHLRGRIDAGQLQPGDRLPSTRTLVREFDVAMATASKALAHLRQEGYAVAVPGVATVVAHRSRQPARAMSPVGATDATLTRARVIATAMHVADGEGITSLSMRRVAAELGSSTMSLYRHVRSREELLELMADEVCGEISFPAQPPAGWRERLEWLALRQWESYSRHPWAAQVISLTRPQLIPRGMAHTEFALAALGDLGLTRSEMLHLAVSLMNFVRGTAISLESEHQAVQDTGVTQQQWIESRSEGLRLIMFRGSFPLLVHVTKQPGVHMDLQSLFEFGLARLLDGFAALIDQAGRRRAAGPA